jgi:CDP-6-deoxy-D-xylo-4-hexulose-3-dehydrase
MRNTEIGGVIGRSQLRRLDRQNEIRRRNLELFLSLLDPEKYRTDFDTEGQCNYAFTLALRHPDSDLCDRVMTALRERGIEFRRGASGGGNQLRQPYLRKRFGEHVHRNFPETEHIHFYGFYIGNYPDLEEDHIIDLCALLNTV